MLQPDPYPEISPKLPKFAVFLPGKILASTVYKFSAEVKMQEGKECCIKGEVFIAEGPYVQWDTTKIRGLKVSPEKVLDHEAAHIKAISNRMKALAALMEEEIECYETKELAETARELLDSLYKSRAQQLWAEEEAHDQSGGYGTPPPGSNH